MIYPNAFATLKHLKNETLPFDHLSIGDLTRFTDFTDPKPRAKEVFSFHRPETLSDWLKQSKSLRKRLHDLTALQTQKLRECQINAINNLENFRMISQHLHHYLSGRPMKHLNSAIDLQGRN